MMSETDLKKKKNVLYLSAVKTFGSRQFLPIFKLDKSNQFIYLYRYTI